jgi:ferredoxin-thioredoxin reductase catalytic subunit
MKSQILNIIVFLHTISLCQSFQPGTLRLSPVTAQRMPTLTQTAMAKDDDMTEEERAIALEKATKAMTAFSNTYIKNTNTKYCSDKSIPAVVIKGLAEHKVTLGAPLCPCRYYEDKEKEAKDGFWNCPCVPMRERHECHCMLFLTEDNDFVGEETVSFHSRTKLVCLD